MILIYWIKESVRLIGIEDFIAVHHGHEVFCIGEVDDIMGVAREHVHGLDVVAIDFPLQHLPFRVIKVALLYEAVALDHDELLELRIMPVLPLGDARLGDIDAHLTGIMGMHQFCETTAVVHVHLEREGGLLIREIREIRGVQFLGKATGRNLGDHQGLGLSSETLKQIHYFT